MSSKNLIDILTVFLAGQLHWGSEESDSKKVKMINMDMLFGHRLISFGLIFSTNVGHLHIVRSGKDVSCLQVYIRFFVELPCLRDLTSRRLVLFIP